MGEQVRGYCNMILTTTCIPKAFPPDWRELAVQPAAREFHQLHTNLRQPINGVLRRLKIFRLREPF